MWNQKAHSGCCAHYTASALRYQTTEQMTVIKDEWSCIQRQRGRAAQGRAKQGRAGKGKAGQDRLGHSTSTRQHPYHSVRKSILLVQQDSDEEAVGARVCHVSNAQQGCS